LSDIDKPTSINGWIPFRPVVVPKIVLGERIS